jgi:hypothetical protein
MTNELPQGLGGKLGKRSAQRAGHSHVPRAEKASRPAAISAVKSDPIRCNKRHMGVASDAGRHCVAADGGGGLKGGAMRKFVLFIL